MNHLNRVYHTAIALQGARTFKTELAGIGATPQGEEFAKAISEAACEGFQPREIAEQVTKAMAGNEDMAMSLLESVAEIAKAHIESHTRTLANGKMVNVHAYETARTAAMKATTNAHGATFHAMRMKSPEAHENAARMHEEAAKQHTEAHELHPRDVPEVGQEHANLKGQHQMAADFHRTEAQNIRQNEVYSRLRDKAEVASSGTEQAYDTHQKMDTHRAAGVAHAKAAEAKPGAGHEEKAEAHHAIADAHEAEYRAHFTKLPYGVVKKAATASGDAAKATVAAHKANTPDAHMKAAQAHEAAINAHMDVHGEHEDDEDGQHGQIAQRHMKLHAYHAQKANKDTAGVPVAKADGCMTITPTTTDLAKKTGGEAMAVEGRPGEKQAKKDEEEAKEELAKSHVEGHTREQAGKIVQVSAYDTHFQGSMKASGAAHQATATAKNAASHATAAAAHMKASEAHSTAAEYAPEGWQKQGHLDNAKLHTHYAQAHHAKADAANLRGDTGVDTPKHTAQDLKEMEGHDDYQGYGYLGHEGRSAQSDAALAEAASRANISKHELAAHVLGVSGRHMMDDHSKLKGKDATHDKRVAHMQRWLTDPKNAKAYGIKEYAKDLEERSGEAKGKPAKKEYDPNGPAPHEQGFTSEDPDDKRRMVVANRQKGTAEDDEMPDAKVEHRGKVSNVEFGQNSGRAVLHPEHREVLGKMEDGGSDTIEDEQGTKWDVARKGEHLHFKAQGASGLKGKVKASEFQAFPKKGAQGKA